MTEKVVDSEAKDIRFFDLEGNDYSENFNIEECLEKADHYYAKDQ